MKKLWLVVGLAILVIAPTAALAQTKAAYHGGTVAVFQGVQEEVRGTLSTTDSSALALFPTEKQWSSSILRIPYSGIETIDYERREAGKGKILTGAVLGGAIGATAMAERGLRYLITLRYTDESGTPQVAILAVEPTKAFHVIAEIEERSGKQRSVRVSRPASADTAVPRPNDLKAVDTAAPRLNDPKAVKAAAPRPDTLNEAALRTVSPAPSAPEKTAISNDDVVNMARVGLGDDVIIMRVKSARPLFDTSANALVALKTAGVSDRVIAVMIELKP